jgi:serine protease AprX
MGSPSREPIAATRSPAGNSRAAVCGFCQTGLGAAARGALDPDALHVVLANNPWWRPDDGLCSECAARFSEAFERTRSRYPGFARGALPVLPTPVRLFAHDQLSGRGVTIAFLDSGFSAHPDLVEPRDRIVAYVDVNDRRAGKARLRQPDDSSWHGTMTSVVACGNGRLSGGLYRGLASQARLALVKVGSARRIVHDDIARGLEWAISHRRRLGIRIVNVSCGGDYEASYLDDRLSQAADAATHAGMLVVAAAGNLGLQPNHPVLPPASAPSVLTVGGLDDKNRLAVAGYDMYHSSYGPTLDGLQKPEVIAPGIWVAAPILPGTPAAARAELLSRLSTAPDTELRGLLVAHAGADAELDAAASHGLGALRALVAAKLREHKIVAGAYTHVDGTSFAAPIVTSVAAQMFEANPRLSPQQAKLILIRTARRIPHAEVDRQGWGVVDAARAVEAALQARRQRPAPHPS